MTRAEVQKEQEQAWLAVLLAWVAGGVDAVGYVTLFNLFTAHMSGNSVAMGVFFGEGHWSQAFRSLFPIPLYIGGVVLGAALGEWAARSKLRSPFAIALSLEGLLLIVFMLNGSGLPAEARHFISAPGTFYALAATLPLAMGLQSATLSKVGNQNIRTTFVTGILTTFGESLVHYGYWLKDHWRRTPLRCRSKMLRISLRQTQAQKLFICGSIFGGYVIGAILCGFVMTQWNLWAVCFPLGGLSLVIVIDLVRPIERSQKEK